MAEKETIGTALARVQAELKAPKGQFNAFGKYKYRSAEDILEAAKPIVVKHGCVLFLSDELATMGNRIYVKSSATIQLQSDRGESLTVTAFAREEESKKGMDGSQVTGASSSYARKYALNGLLCIDDTKDSDGTNHGDNAPRETPKPTPRISPVEATKRTAWGNFKKLSSLDPDATPEVMAARFKDAASSLVGKEFGAFTAADWDRVNESILKDLAKLGGGEQ